MFIAYPRASHLLLLTGRDGVAILRWSHFPRKLVRAEMHQGCFTSTFPRSQGGKFVLPKSKCHHHRCMSTTAEEFGMCSRVLLTYNQSTFCAGTQIEGSILERYLENASAIRTPPSALFHYIDNDEISKYLKPLYRSYWSIIHANNR